MYYAIYYIVLYRAERFEITTENELLENLRI